MADGFIGMFHVPEPGAIIPKCNDISAMVLAATEVAIQKSNSTSASAKLDISNIDISEGKISTVIVEHKLSDDSVWEKVGNRSVEWSGNDNTAIIIIGHMDFTLTGIDHDFRVYFQNGDGELAVQSSNSQEIGGAAGYLIDEDVTFNGHSDLAEYPEVLDLIASNASNTEGSTWASPANLPTNGIVRLAWKDMRQEGTLASHPLADGTTATVSWSQWKNLTSYKVFMYIGSTAAPTVEYPKTTEANGTWYLVADTTNNYVEVDCPKNKKIAFWVGAAIRLSGASDTAAVPTLGYPQY